jgi:hypothetical protein
MLRIYNLVILKEPSAEEESVLQNQADEEEDP